PQTMIDILLSNLEDQSLLTLVELLIDAESSYQDNRRTVLRHLAKRMAVAHSGPLVNVLEEAWAGKLARRMLTDVACLNALTPEKSGLFVGWTISDFHIPKLLNVLPKDNDFQYVVIHVLLMGVEHP